MGAGQPRLDRSSTRARPGTLRVDTPRGTALSIAIRLGACHRRRSTRRVTYSLSGAGRSAAPQAAAELNRPMSVCRDAQSGVSAAAQSDPPTSPVTAQEQVPMRREDLDRWLGGRPSDHEGRVLRERADPLIPCAAEDSHQPSRRDRGRRRLSISGVIAKRGPTRSHLRLGRSPTGRCYRLPRGCGDSPRTLAAATAASDHNYGSEHNRKPEPG
jgi:hypothetical protein